MKHFAIGVVFFDNLSYKLRHISLCLFWRHVAIGIHHYTNQSNKMSFFRLSNNDGDNQPIKKILILVECPNKKETDLASP